MTLETFRPDFPSLRGHGQLCDGSQKESFRPYLVYSISFDMMVLDCTCSYSSYFEGNVKDKNREQCRATSKRLISKNNCTYLLNKAQ